MNITKLLPPATAVRMVWARTGKFSNDVYSKSTADLTELALKDIKDTAQKNDDKEKEYVISAIATMDACLRNMDIIYKGRQLNFAENEKLRAAYLDSITENLNFGTKAKDFLQSLPAMAIGSAGGVTVAQYFGITEINLWVLGLALGAAGFAVNWLILRAMRKRKQQLYIEQDYERNLYYEQYITRVGMTLASLYEDLDRIHKNVFNQRYPLKDDEKVNKIIDNILKGVSPTFCKYVHKHIKVNIITPELWTKCETGDEAVVKDCGYWGK